MKAIRQIRNERDRPVNRDVSKWVRHPGEFQKERSFRITFIINRVSNRRGENGLPICAHSERDRDLNEVNDRGQPEYAAPAEAFRERAAAEISDCTCSGPDH